MGICGLKQSPAVKAQQIALRNATLQGHIDAMYQAIQPAQFSGLDISITKAIRNMSAKLKRGEYDDVRQDCLDILSKLGNPGEVRPECTKERFEAVVDNATSIAKALGAVGVPEPSFAAAQVARGVKAPNAAAMVRLNARQNAGPSRDAVVAPRFAAQDARPLPVAAAKPLQVHGAPPQVALDVPMTPCAGAIRNAMAAVFPLASHLGCEEQYAAVEAAFLPVGVTVKPGSPEAKRIADACDKAIAEIELQVGNQADAQQLKVLFGNVRAATGCPEIPVRAGVQNVGPVPGPKGPPESRASRAGGRPEGVLQHWDALGKATKGFDSNMQAAGAFIVIQDEFFGGNPNLHNVARQCEIILKCVPQGPHREAALGLRAAAAGRPSGGPDPSMSLLGASGGAPGGPNPSMLLLGAARAPSFATDPKTQKLRDAVESLEQEITRVPRFNGNASLQNLRRELAKPQPDVLTLMDLAGKFEDAAVEDARVQAAAAQVSGEAWRLF